MYGTAEYEPLGAVVSLAGGGRQMILFWTSCLPAVRWICLAEIGFGVGCELSGHAGSAWTGAYRSAVCRHRLRSPSRARYPCQHLKRAGSAVAIGRIVVGMMPHGLFWLSSAFSIAACQQRPLLARLAR